MNIFQLKYKYSSQLSLVAVFGFAALLLLGLQLQPTAVGAVDDTLSTKAPRGINLDKLYGKIKAESSKSYPTLLTKDSSDKDSAWSIAAVAPGYDFSSSVDLGKYHYSLQTTKANATLPSTAFKRMASMVLKEGGLAVKSPIPTTYPSKNGSSNYFKFKNATCYLDMETNISKLNLDCAYNSEFAKVAKAVKPFVALYTASNNSKKSGKDYAAHMAFTGKTADGTIEYAAVPLDGTVAYYYNVGGSGWKYHAESGTGLACANLSGEPKNAFSTICKVQ